MARNVEIGNKNFRMQYLEEAFTSEHWLLRIYRVSPPGLTPPPMARPWVSR